jgi:hypothetical protein
VLSLPHSRTGSAYAGRTGARTGTKSVDAQARCGVWRLPVQWAHASVAICETNLRLDAAVARARPVPETLPDHRVLDHPRVCVSSTWRIARLLLYVRRY